MTKPSWYNDTWLPLSGCAGLFAQFTCLNWNAQFAQFTCFKWRVVRTVHMLELKCSVVYFGFSRACAGLFAQFTCLNWNAQFAQFTCWIHDFSELNRPGRNDTDNKLFLAKHGIETWSTGQAFIKLVYNVLKVSKRISKHWAPDSSLEVACDAFVNTHIVAKRRSSRLTWSGRNDATSDVSWQSIGQCFSWLMRDL